MSALYKTISEAREVAEAMYPTFKHVQIQEKMGIGRALYEDIRHYDPVTVSENLSIEEENSLKEFIRTCNGLINPFRKEEPKPEPKVSVKVQKPWKNPFPDSPLMKALEKLSDAADEVKALGYEVKIGVTKKEEEEWDSYL